MLPEHQEAHPTIRDLDAFRRQINENCTLTEKEMVPKITIDIAMPFSYVSENLLSQMQLLRPFGKGNTRPLFAQKNLRTSFLRVFGKNRNVAKLQLTDEQGRRIPAVYFGDADAFAAYAGNHETLSVIYYPGIDQWQGRRTIQLTIVSYR